MSDAATRAAALLLLAGCLACRPDVACVETRSGHTVAITPLSVDSADTVGLRIAGAATQRLAEAICANEMLQLVDYDPIRRFRSNDRSPQVQTMVMGSVLRVDQGTALTLKAVNVETGVVRYSALVHVGGADPDSAALVLSRLFLDSLAGRIGTPARGMR